MDTTVLIPVSDVAARSRQGRDRGHLPMPVCFRKGAVVPSSVRLMGGRRLEGTAFSREVETRLIGRSIEGYREPFAWTGLDLPVNPNREDLTGQAGGAAG